MESTSNGGWAGAAIIAATLGCPAGAAIVGPVAATVEAAGVQAVRVVVLVSGTVAALVLDCDVATGGAPTKIGTEILVSCPLVE